MILSFKYIFKASLLNLYFQISSQYENIFGFICVVSFNYGLRSSLVSLVNSFISDFISLDKSYLNIN